jgi:hypothetical protein
MIKNLISLVGNYIMLGFDKYVGPWIQSLMLVFTIPHPKERHHLNELLDDDEVEDYLTYSIDESEETIHRKQTTKNAPKPPFVQEENGFV